MARATREEILTLVVAQSKLRTADLKFVVKSGQGELARRDEKKPEKGTQTGQTLGDVVK